MIKIHIEFIIYVSNQIIKLNLTYIIIIIIKSVANSSQGSHTDQLDFCNWLADGSTTG